MKKVIFSALVLGGLFACSKADNHGTTLSSNDDVMAPLRQSYGSTGELRRVYQNNGKEPASYECTGAGGTCAGNRIAAPNHIALLEEFLVAGANNSQLFAEHDAALATYFGASAVSAVNSGQLTVEVTGEIETSMFFVFSEDGNEIMVVPIIK